MKKILIVLIGICTAVTAKSQSADEKVTADSTVFTTDMGVVSAKAKSGNYAVLYIYRPKSRKRSFASFTINVNDSAVCKIKSDNRYTIKIYKAGTKIIWARSEKKSMLTMNMEIGKEYYLKCNTKPAMWGENPKLSLMDPAIGKQEFNNAEDGD